MEKSGAGTDPQKVAGSEAGPGKIVATKGDKQIEMSYLLSPKTSLGDKDLDKILGNNFSNVKDLIEAGKNEFLEIGEIYHEKSLSRGNYVINVRSNKGHTLSFKIGDHIGKKVKDVKEALFGKEITDGCQVKFIMNGKVVDDKDEILQLKVDNRCDIQAFISPRINFSNDEKEAQAIKQNLKPDPSEDKDKPLNLADALNGQRGFDYFKINGYTDQEIIWKRYIFHSESILTMSLDNINDDTLFLKEECFLMENQKYIKKPELFKFCEFKPEFNEVILFRTKVARVLYFLLGVAVGIPFLMLTSQYDLREDKRISLLIGTALQLLLITLFGVPALVQ